ncbi:hypothetical protein NLJ89_g6425 [Agrocybe chaxingu]|uniref:SWIM-type domain-containing protein n=1 Tax=Agrocybe chaxingu TaxID=84603 RepID=A0A9W8JZ71_9AGAR|nr:hypothetical protein NLJ89_g6425 [Agrocybe chaxingu]
MVLKRKRGDDFVPWTSSSQEQAQTSAQTVVSATDPVLPPEKRIRSNPPRSTRSKPSESAAVRAQKAKAAPPKKPRAPRTKKAPVAVPPPTAVAGPSSSQPAAPTPTPAPAKRGRKKAASSEPSGSQPKPEKRLAQFKPQCPQNILDRLARVRSQRIFMIDRERNGNELKEKFTILGSTNNVYTVTIEHLPRCNCPDAVKGNHCKHILFVFAKVLQVSLDSGLWYQKALLTSELEKIFAEAPLAPNSMAHTHIRDAYARATGKAPANAAPADAGPGNKRIPGPDDDCPICYDGMFWRV